jgi:4-alpha-glucanotransferase
VERKRALRYVGKGYAGKRNKGWALIRTLMMSCADTVILPVQDILGLDERGRMNNPARVGGNWEWRMQPGSIRRSIREKLLDVTLSSGRG